MKNIFGLNIKIVLLILTFSSITGIIYNTLSSKGISIFSNPKEIKWAEDKQLINSDLDDSIENKSTRTNNLKNPDSLVQIVNQIESKVKSTRQTAIEATSPKAVNLKQGYLLYKSNNVTFIDARDKWDFSEGHIKGSVNIPYYNFDKNNNALKNISKSQVIVTYCDGDDCEMSKKLAQDLIELGYTKVYFLFGGWSKWTKANYPVEKAEN